MHSKNEMVVMTIPYRYFSCMYILLVVRRLLCKIDMYASTFIPHIITFSYDVYASFICDSITGYGSTLYIGIDMVFCILPIH